MSTRKIKPLPPELTELTRLIFDLGQRKLVLVEGPDDVAVFREWYRRDGRSQIEFYPAEGHDNVESHLNKILKISATKRAYGIIDRDFRDEAEVKAKLANPNEHLFILPRYALENYLLEPAVVFEELRAYHGEEFAVVDVKAMEQDLLDLCRQLKPIMAANWVFWDEYMASGSASIEFFTEGFPVDNRDLLLQESQKRLGCSKAEAEQRIAEKEALLDTVLTRLEAAHTRTNGKHLLQRLSKRYQISTTKSHFRRLLARTTAQIALHSDIQAIVEERILAKGDSK